MTESPTPTSPSLPVDAAAVERLLAETTAELAEWTAGRRSHTNVIMGFASGAEAQVMIAQADAAEVQRLSAAVQGFAAALAPLLQAQHDGEDVRAAQAAAVLSYLRGYCNAGTRLPPVGLIENVLQGSAALSSPAPTERDAECGPCAEAHPAHACGDVDCWHNCHAEADRLSEGGDRG